MDKRNLQQDTKIAEIKIDIAWIKKEITDIKTNHLCSIYKKLECLDKKLNRRPTWLISCLFTSLIAIIVALLTYLLKS